MATKIIGIKEFRQNINKIWKEGRDKNIRYIITHHTEPIFEMNPLQKNEFFLEKLAKKISKARKESREGQRLSIDQVRKELGL